jgi:hypothetical protein
MVNRRHRVKILNAKCWKKCLCFWHESPSKFWETLWALTTVPDDRIEPGPLLFETWADTMSTHDLHSLKRGVSMKSKQAIFTGIAALSLFFNLTSCTSPTAISDQRATKNDQLDIDLDKIDVTQDAPQVELELAAKGPIFGVLNIAANKPFPYVRGVVNDSNGNLIVVGSSNATARSDGNQFPSDPNRRNNPVADVFVQKLNSGGDLLWSRDLGSDHEDYARAVAVGPSDLIAVAGITAGSLRGQPNAGLQDAFVTVYASNGTRLWTRSLGAIGDDGATSVSFDRFGNVLIAGYACGSGQQIKDNTIKGACDMFLSKYSVGGTRVWTRLFAGEKLDVAGSLAINPQGEAYIVGGTTVRDAGPGGNKQVTPFIAKYSANGNALGQYVIPQTAATETDIARGIAIDKNGDVIVGGTSSSTTILGNTVGVGSGGFLMKLDRNLNLRWFKFVVNEVPFKDQFVYSGSRQIHTVSVDAKGNIYTLGKPNFESETLENTRSAPIRFSSDGQYLDDGGAWETVVERAQPAPFNDASGLYSFAAMTLTPSGDVVIVGELQGGPVSSQSTIGAFDGAFPTVYGSAGQFTATQGYLVRLNPKLELQ